jgi:hypothetical protein
MAMGFNLAFKGLRDSRKARKLDLQNILRVLMEEKDNIGRLGNRWNGTE